MKLLKTPLNKEQILRLVNLYNIEEPVVEANFVRVEGTVVKKIDVKYKKHTESFYINEEDYDLIENGIYVGRL